MSTMPRGSRPLAGPRHSARQAKGRQGADKAAALLPPSSLLPSSTFLLFYSSNPKLHRINTHFLADFFPVFHRSCIVEGRRRQGRPRSRDGIARGGCGEHFLRDGGGEGGGGGGGGGGGAARGGGGGALR